MVILNYSKRLYLISLFILILISLTFLIGLNTLNQYWFTVLTPYVIILTAILVLLNHREWNRYFAIFFVITCLAGYLAELTGVETGLLFGRYTYGNILGYKVYGIPVVAGLCWFLMVYSSGMVANLFKYRIFIKALIGALLMVIIDFSMEPVAVHLDLWSWQDSIVPWHNYIGWFLGGFFLNLYFQQLELKKANRLAVALFIILWITFLVLSYTL